MRVSLREQKCVSLREQKCVCLREQKCVSLREQKCVCLREQKCVSLREQKCVSLREQKCVSLREQEKRLLMCSTRDLVKASAALWLPPASWIGLAIPTLPLFLILHFLANQSAYFYYVVLLLLFFSFCCLSVCQGSASFCWPVCLPGLSAYFLLLLSVILPTFNITLLTFAGLSVCQASCLADGMPACSCARVLRACTMCT